jgi:2-amino-4-hydroxy-6-hydroxymethyldihydropteridine diphosphokinase
MKHKAYLLFGSNLGDRGTFILKAKERMSGLGLITAESALYKTEPWQMDSEDWFFNQVICLETDLEPEALLEALLQVERTLGRNRTLSLGEGYHSRTIDIDILYFDDMVLDTPNLSIPHPKIHERRFALAPMVELSPSLKHPVTSMTQFEMLKACADQSFLELV